MAEMTIAVPENKELASYTDIVVVRPSLHATRNGMDELVTKLALKGFLPIVQPHELTKHDMRQDKWFPTDQFRDIGSVILVSSPWSFKGVLDKTEPVLGKEAIDELKMRVMGFEMSGGHFLHLNDQRRFLYDASVWDKDNEGLVSVMDVEKFKQQLKMLQDAGWEVDPIHHGNFILKEKLESENGRIRESRQDLDFVFSVFVGKDGKPHGLVHPELAGRIPLDIQTHQIPESEILKGGANVADLRGGSVLICANSKDAPIAFAALNRFAKAEIIEAPPNYVDDGGGPRCSISSISLT